MSRSVTHSAAARTEMREAISPAASAAGGNSTGAAGSCAVLCAARCPSAGAPHADSTQPIAIAALETRIMLRCGARSVPRANPAPDCELRFSDPIWGANHAARRGAAQPRQTPKPQAIGFSSETKHAAPCVSARVAQARIIGVGPTA